MFRSLFGRPEPEPRTDGRGNALMIVGPASHVGKTWTATAICRWLTRRGLRVAPFKAQNMSLNAAVCPDGGEIGRAQATQAAACRLEPRTDMNPLLLKPAGEDGCQVVLHGKVWKTVRNGDLRADYEQLLDEVEESYRRLAEEFDYVVIEGAGGCAELNLKDRDLANLGLASRLGVPAMLVADIHRGGVFASVLGTLELLDEQEKELVRSFVINRFQGDVRLFDEGRRMIEQRAGRPCLGVFPDSPGINLDEEDSVALEERRPTPVEPGGLHIAIIKLPNIANTTDFKLLPQAEYITEAARIDPDLIIIPGTKNTLADLAWMKKTGLDRWVLDKRKDGTAVWGVCGGYQMLGRFIVDPYAFESSQRRLSGLGLLPIQTRMARQKTTRQVRARLAVGGIEFDAYEIHIGETTPSAGESPFCLVDGEPQGYWRRGILGHYLHGALENPKILDALLADVAEWRSKTVPRPSEEAPPEQVYDRLADWFEASVDVGRFEELYL
ncbi:MAG: cobyric acid synthase [Bryobacterales bacterium]